MNKIKKYEALIIIVFSILIVIPFINQAYYIDDDIYLNAALKYNQSGLDSFSGLSEQEGYIVPNYYLTHPLLWPWMISIIIKIFNSTNESLLHFMQFVNVIIIGLAALSISKIFSKEPLITTLFFLFIPAVVLLSHVMMTDIPTLAFFLLAIALYLEAIEKRSTLLFILSGLSASAAWGISYQALFLIFLFILYNFQVKEKSFKAYVPVIIPLLFFSFWFLGTWIRFGIPHPLIAFQWGGDYTRSILDDFLYRLIGNINSIGAAAVLPIFILFYYFFIRRFRILLLCCFIISLMGIFIIVPEYWMLQKVLFIIYFTAGSFLLLRMIIFLKDSIKTKEKKDIFLAVWFTTFFSAVAVGMPLGVARYLLPCLLPLVIVFVNDLKNYISGKRFQLTAVIGLCLTLVYSILCSIADYHLADTYRMVSSEISKKYKNKNVWFSSDGLKWYMERKDFKPLIYGDNRPEEGDLVVISSELWAYDVPEVMSRTKLISKIDFDYIFPLRTMNLAAHAGFYDHLEKALLPFSITRVRFERFSIYQVEK